MQLAQTGEVLLWQEAPYWSGKGASCKEARQHVQMMFIKHCCFPEDLWRFEVATKVTARLTVHAIVGYYWVSMMHIVCSAQCLRCPWIWSQEFLPAMSWFLWVLYRHWIGILLSLAICEAKGRLDYFCTWHSELSDFLQQLLDSYVNLVAIDTPCGWLSWAIR